MTTFLGVPRARLDALSPGQIVVLGASEATPYEAGKPSHSAGAPQALRQAGSRYAAWHHHHDFDTGGAMLDAAQHGVVDAGDVATAPGMPADNRRAIQAAVEEVLAAGATPVVLGGDDSVPIPVLSAYERHGPLWIVQVDAHIDWREERFGERMGWSSPMRRASEMPWVAGIVQIGARGVGSAEAEDLRDALAWGASIVTARHVHEHGIGALDQIPKGARTFVTFDCDALDPAIMPGVAAPVPGGLTYWHVVALLERLAARSRLVGFDLVELAPQRDAGGLSALTAVRVVTLAIAAIARSRGVPIA